MKEKQQYRIARLLKGSGKTLSAAESCTGGEISHLITTVSGSSEYYLGSVTSYAIPIKERLLGVPAETVETFGVVSPEVAAAMAEGVRLTFANSEGGVLLPNREFEILVDDKKIAEQRLRAETFTAWIDKVYPIPSELTEGREKVTVRVQALPGKIAGGVFGCRVQKQKREVDK